MRKAAHELDETVASPMKRRWEEPWRVNPAAGKRLALRVLSRKKEFIVTGNDIAG